MEAAEASLLAEGAAVDVGGRPAEIVRRAGTDARPIVRVSGVEDRDGAAALRGSWIEAAGDTGEAVEGEWEAEDLVGCEVPGIGPVRRVIAAPSCDLLEVGEEGVLVPFVSDAILRVDPEGRVIEADLRFLGLDGTGDDGAAA